MPHKALGNRTYNSLAVSCKVDNRHDSTYSIKMSPFRSIFLIDIPISTGVKISQIEMFINSNQPTYLYKFTAFNSVNI